MQRIMMTFDATDTSSSSPLKSSIQILLLTYPFVLFIVTHNAVGTRQKLKACFLALVGTLNTKQE